MASYDRRILVPYLQDVCTVELLCVKLTREIDESQKRIANLNGQINRKVIDPVKPSLADCEEKGSASDSGAMIIWIFIFTGVGAWLWQWTPIGALVPIAIALIMLCGWISDSNAQQKSAQKSMTLKCIGMRREYGKMKPGVRACPNIELHCRVNDSISMY